MLAPWNQKHDRLNIKVKWSHSATQSKMGEMPIRKQPYRDHFMHLIRHKPFYQKKMKVLLNCRGQSFDVVYTATDSDAESRVCSTISIFCVQFCFKISDCVYVWCLFLCILAESERGTMPKSLFISHYCFGTGRTLSQSFASTGYKPSLRFNSMCFVFPSGVSLL